MMFSSICSALSFRSLLNKPWSLLDASLLVMVLFGVEACSSEQISNDNLYQELGGRPGIEHIVRGLTQLYQTDPRIKEDFANINPSWLTRRLTDYICATADGPCVYKGRDMVSAHKGLGLNTAKFNAVVEDLETAMDEAKIPYNTQNRLLARLAPTRRDIVAY